MSVAITWEQVSVALQCAHAVHNTVCHDSAYPHRFGVIHTPTSVDQSVPFGFGLTGIICIIKTAVSLWVCPEFFSSSALTLRLRRRVVKVAKTNWPFAVDGYTTFEGALPGGCRCARWSSIGKSRCGRVVSLVMRHLGECDAG